MIKSMNYKARYKFLANYNFANFAKIISDNDF